MKLPQLSLRELFLLVALAAMGCGWWVDRRTCAAAQRRADAEAWKAAARIWLPKSDADIVYAQYLAIKGEGPPLIPPGGPSGVTGVHVFPNRGR